MSRIGTECNTASADAICLGALLWLRVAKFWVYQGTDMADSPVLVSDICDCLPAVYPWKGALIYKTEDVSIVMDGLGLVVPVLRPLAHWVEDLGFLAIFSRTSFDLVFDYGGSVQFNKWTGQELPWWICASCIAGVLVKLLVLQVSEHVIAKGSPVAASCFIHCGFRLFKVSPCLVLRPCRIPDGIRATWIAHGTSQRDSTCESMRVLARTTGCDG